MMSQVISLQSVPQTVSVPHYYAHWNVFVEVVEDEVVEVEVVEVEVVEAEVVEAEVVVTVVLLQG